MRESCTNSCSQWCSQVAPKIGTAGEKPGYSVPQCQGQAGGEQKDTPVAPVISHSNPENEPKNEPDGLVQGVLSSSPSSAGGPFTASFTGCFENTAIECMKSCLFSLWSALSASCKSLEQIHREKGLVFAKEFPISVGVFSGGFSTGFVWVSVLEQLFHCFGFQGQCLNHLNSCLLLTYWPCSLLIAYFHPY